MDKNERDGLEFLEHACVQATNETWHALHNDRVAERRRINGPWPEKESE